MLRLLVIFFGCFLLAEPATAMVAKYRTGRHRPRNNSNPVQRAAKKLYGAAAKSGKAVARIFRPRLAKTPEVSGYEGLVEELNLLADEQGFALDPAPENLVPLVSDKYFFVDPDMIKPHQRFVLPCVKEELDTIKNEYFKDLDARLRSTQAYRTWYDQNRMSRLVKKLFRVGKKRVVRLVPANINAAAPDGPKTSLHRRAIALDFGRGRLTGRQDKWLQERFMKFNAKAGVMAAVQEDNPFSPNYHVVFCLQKTPRSAPPEQSPIAQQE